MYCDYGQHEKITKNVDCVDVSKAALKIAKKMLKN